MHYALINLSVMAFFGIIGGTIFYLLSGDGRNCSSFFLSFLLWVGYLLLGCVFAPAMFAIGAPMLVFTFVGISLHNVSLKNGNNVLKLSKAMSQDWFSAPIVILGGLGGFALTVSSFMSYPGPQIASFYTNILYTIGNFLVQLS